MKESLTKAIQNTELVYDDLKVIADEMFKPWAEDVNELVDQARNVNSLNNDQLRDLIFRLAVKSFSFGEIKEKASFKAVLAETLRKEAYAKEFASAEGAVAAKESMATLNTSSETVTEVIYDLVSNLFKVKMDEIHRLVDSLKTILTSRLTEAKLTSAIQTNVD